MNQKLIDARAAIGFGVLLISYGAFTLYQYWYNRNREHVAMQAKMILDNASEKRAELLEQEGVETP